MIEHPPVEQPQLHMTLVCNFCAALQLSYFGSLTLLHVRNNRHVLLQEPSWYSHSRATQHGSPFTLSTRNLRRRLTSAGTRQPLRSTQNWRCWSRLHEWVPITEDATSDMTHSDEHNGLTASVHSWPGGTTVLRNLSAIFFRETWRAYCGCARCVSLSRKMIFEERLGAEQLWQACQM